MVVCGCVYAIKVFPKYMYLPSARDSNAVGARSGMSLPIAVISYAYLETSYS
jgi:hypothetical protein